MEPVIVRQEVEGFVFNRLQGALLREAYCLVRDGVASVEEVDRVVRDGLGLRWSVLGPFETADLNTRGGIASHAEKMGPAYARMGAQRGQNDPWTPDLVAKVTAQRRALLPLERWDERVAWRDRKLMAHIRDRKAMKGTRRSRSISKASGSRRGPARVSLPRWPGGASWRSAARGAAPNAASSVAWVSARIASWKWTDAPPNAPA
jgi:3-hydroxyacyl-CoA dehydrogenase